MDTVEDFPLHGGGKVVFHRDLFIKKTATLVLDKKESSRYRSHYWRATAGAGKTVFLKLMGRELQKRGCDVYMITGPLMDKYDEGYFSNLAKEGGDKTVVLMVDEVQKNLTSWHWDAVLKGSQPANLLVLGVGLPQLDGYSPQFDDKYPVEGDLFPMFLTLDDLPEVCLHFNKSTSQTEEITARVCERLLEFTAGHLFPFIAFVRHLLDPDSKINLTDIGIDKYLASKEFSDSATFGEVRNRCFGFMKYSLLTSAEKVLFKIGGAGDKEALEKFGVLNEDAFVSPLLIGHVFSKIKVPRSLHATTMDRSKETPYAQQIICAGLRDMNEEDFKDAHYEMDAVENAVGFKWGYNVKAVLGDVWVAPQVRTMNKDHKGRGPKPVIDFFFNGRYNIVIELALNLKADGVQEHVARFDNYYSRYDSVPGAEFTGAVFHIQTENDHPVIDMKEPYNTPKYKNYVYTFVKRRNALFRGSSLVKSNVSKWLSISPVKSYSTFALGFLRRVVKGLK